MAIKKEISYSILYNDGEEDMVEVSGFDFNSNDDDDESAITYLMNNMIRQILDESEIKPMSVKEIKISLE